MPLTCVWPWQFPGRILRVTAAGERRTLFRGITRADSKTLYRDMYEMTRFVALECRKLSTSASLRISRIAACFSFLLRRSPSAQQPIDTTSSDCVRCRQPRKCPGHRRNNNGNSVPQLPAMAARMKMTGRQKTARPLASDVINQSVYVLRTQVAMSL